MTTSEGSNGDAVVTKEPRPFLFLRPSSMPLATEVVDEGGQQLLEEFLELRISFIIRGLVDLSIAQKNAHSRLPQPIPISVLNRRRRAARFWLLAISGGKLDAATRHLVATQWMPILCGTGPDHEGIIGPARVLVEYVRGSIAALIFEAPSENLIPNARALHVLESTLAAHLGAVHYHAWGYQRSRLASRSR